MKYFIGMDIGVQNSFRWVVLDQHGTVYSEGKHILVLRKLMDELLADEDNLIAVGVEAPMWIPLPKIKKTNYEFGPRFYGEEKREWYLDNGGGASIKAISLLSKIFEGLEYSCTVDKSNWKKEICRVYLFEGFVTGDSKPHFQYNYLMQRNFFKSKHSVDAYLTALSFYVVDSSKYYLITSILAYSHNQINSYNNVDAFISIWHMIFHRNNVIIDPKQEYPCNIYSFSF
ncbi:hypothetical protein [Paenibacillus shenyangensis]|uniref:hypothetical protein n=1 Tax=Paenibacillus sp. A9 TaxID=1284352 RepID=UPI0003779C3C|nr:hypothetical protein [Paenibacillus sp. A9]